MTDSKYEIDETFIQPREILQRKRRIATILDEKYQDWTFRKTMFRHFSNDVYFLLYLLFDVEKIMKEKGEKLYIGLTGQTLLKILQNRGTEYTYTDLLRVLNNLCRFQLIHRSAYQKNYYYRIHKDAFVCYNGLYIYSDFTAKEPTENFFYVGICNYGHLCHQFCTECVCEQGFQKQCLNGCMSLSYLERKLHTFPFFERFQQLIADKNAKLSYIDKYIQLFEKYLERLNKNIVVHDLTIQEVLFYGQQIYEIEADSKKRPEARWRIIRSILLNIYTLINDLTAKDEMSNIKEFNYAKIIKRINLNKHQFDDLGELKNETIVPSMINVLNILQYGTWELHKNPKQTFPYFPGFSLYQIGRYAATNWISGETVFNHMYNLIRFGFADKTCYPKHLKPTTGRNEYYFRYTSNAFHCFDGLVIHDLKTQCYPESIWTHVCPHIVSCDRNPHKCQYQHKLTDFLSHIFNHEYPSEHLQHTFLVRHINTRIRTLSTRMNQYNRFAKMVEGFIRQCQQKQQYIKRDSRYLSTDTKFTAEEMFQFLNVFEIIKYGHTLTNIQNIQCSYPNNKKYLFLYQTLYNILVTYYKKKHKEKQRSQIREKEYDEHELEQIRQLIYDQIMSLPLDEKIQL